jgi:hypothetical protein
MFCTYIVRSRFASGEYRATVPSYSDNDAYGRVQPGEKLCPLGTAASEVLAAGGTVTVGR